MNTRKSGRRFPLLLYRRAMDRLWQITLPLGILLGILWWQSGIRQISLISGKGDTWILLGSVLALAISLLAILGRNFAYAQARRDFIFLATPFLRVRVSYRRVRSIHPVKFATIFPPSKSGWMSHRFLAPFYSQTAVVVELNGYPLDPRILRLFLPDQMLSPHSKGLVFLVPDWMAFSTELDTFQEAWRRSQAPQRTFTR